MFRSALQSTGTAWQAARYVGVGSVVYAVDLGVFALLTANSVRPAPANAVSKVIAACVGFALHRSVTFRVAGAPFRLADLGRYLALLAANTTATSLLLWILTEAFGLPATPSKVAVDLVAILAAFLGSKFLVFRDNRPNAGK